MKRNKNDSFPNVHTEGILLPPDILIRVAEPKPNLDGLTPADYHLPEGERTNEAVNRSWNRLLALWMSFRAAMEKLPKTDAGTGLTRDRWLLPLFQELGFGRLQRHKAVTIDHKSYPISHIWEHTPIHLVGSGIEIDKRTPGQAGAAQASPHSLVQEFLNRSEDHLWAFLSNGLKLRILRDNLSLVRQAYVEFDLEAMMEGELYSDFRLLWLLCHQSRVEGERPEQCWLEKWVQTAREQGARALDQLREGVETAIAALGSGFLAAPPNRSLRDQLADGTLDAQDYYRQLLRLVYRLIFLFVAEDRDMLLDPEATDTVKGRYREFYSTQRLRHLAGKLRGGRHDDLFESLKVVMDRLYEKGSLELGLPALGSFLWAPEKIQDLQGLRIRNRDFLEAIRALAFSRQDHALRPIDYRNLGSEELGSVYESLLELHPELHREAGTFELMTAAGHERKTTGSYYTPSSLINELLDSALEPVLDEAAAKPEPEKAILDLKVCDPAVGSGHFLVAAAHRIARRLASVRTGDEEPAPSELSHALRDIVGHCLYGVDINEMAVELCKVSLWMTAVEPGRPLSFLDHRIRHGNSLLGTAPALMAKGIPDEAFKPITGDDKEFCKEYKKQNKKEREARMQDMFGYGETPHEEYCKLREAVSRINAVADDSINGVKEQAAVYDAVMNSEECRHSHLIAHAWCAAFVWKKRKEGELDYPITETVFRKIEEGPEHCPPWMRKEIYWLSRQYQFFHWQLEFPDVFKVPGEGEQADNSQTGWSGGFDVVLGNPPWERIKLEEKEWFAGRNPDIANSKTAVARQKKILGLADTDPTLYTEYQRAVRKSEAVIAFARNSSRYPLMATGDINTYALFIETNSTIRSPFSRVGCVAPSGVATDKSTSIFFQRLLKDHLLVSFLDFENRRQIFPGVQGNIRFCLLTFGSGAGPYFKVAAQLDDPGQLNNEGLRYNLSIEDVSNINPNTLNCPTFSNRRHAEINKAIYSRLPVFVREGKRNNNSWGIEYATMFHLTNASSLFATREELEDEGYLLVGNEFRKEGSVFVPLYEAKLAYQFNHRASTYRGIPADRRFRTHAGTARLEAQDLADPYIVAEPRYWIRDEEVNHRVGDKQWLLTFRDVISAVADSRSLVSTIIPIAGVGNTLPILLTNSAADALSLVAILNSFILDYALRQKAVGGHLNYYLFKQLPAPTPEILAQTCLWDLGVDCTVWIRKRSLELTYTAWDLKSIADNLDETGNPFRWDETRRFMIRCELDAAFFHLYGIERDDVDYIMETFPIVKKRDVLKYDDYHTKLVILDIYDKMKTAMDTGEPYQTLLDPPPADPRVAHPPREEVTVPSVATAARMPDLAAVASGAWATPPGVSSDNIALFALIDVLRQTSVPIDVEHVRIVSVLVRNPALALPFMDDKAKKEWVRLIGQEAQPLPANVIPISQFRKGATDRAWGDAVSQLKASGALVEDRGSGRWSAGIQLPQTSGQNWIEGRASVAVRLLADIDLVSVEQNLAAFIRSVQDGTASRAVS